MTKRIDGTSFGLLAELAEGPGADWWEANGDALEHHVLAPLAATLESASESLAEAGEDLRGGRGTLFRVRRDPRFLRGAPPLRPHCDGVLSPGGRRIGSRGSILVRVDAGGGMLAAGSFLLGADGRRALRGAMAAREDRYLAIAAELESAGAPLASEGALVRAPRGFEEAADGPLGPHLRMEEPLARAPLTRAAWRRGDVVDRIACFARATRALRLFHREALDGVPDAPRPPRRRPAG